MAQCVVVTGANRGIGLELARQLAARGDRVLGTARRPDEAPALCAVAARVLPLDQTDAASVAALAASLEDEAVDVLVNNAGAGGGRTPFAELDWDLVASLFATNAIGPLRVTQALLPALRRGGRRLVASIGSDLGSLARNESGGAFGYRASKAALNMLNRSLAHELAPERFSCVVIHPGWVRTDMGGAEAPLAVEDSVAGLLRVIDGLGPSDTGRFLDHHGRTIPW